MTLKITQFHHRKISFKIKKQIHEMVLNKSNEHINRIITIRFIRVICIIYLSFRMTIILL